MRRKNLRRGAQNTLSNGKLCRSVQPMSVDPFTAISDPNRRFLLEELRRAPKTVNELAAMLPVSRPAVSQHLKALLDNQLVSVTSEGTRRIYAINPQGFRKIGFWLDQFWA